MCNCIEEVNKKLAEADSNTLLDVPMTISMSTNEVKASRLTVATKKANTKVRKKAMILFCAYCPFCGELY